MSVDIIRDEAGNPVPWMTYPAIDFLKKNLNKNHKIFEFGCGSSTLFFAERVKQVTGIETREKWFAMLNIALQEARLDNVELSLMEDGLTNDFYQTFAKNSGKKFDFIIVDSIKRFLSATNSIDALKPGGSIILDDSERDNYKKIFDFFAEKNFTRQDFPGVAPMQTREKNTTIFTLPGSPPARG